MKNSSFEKKYVIIIFLAALIFIVRGPFRAIDNSADLTGPYLQSFTWVDGGNPYQPAKVLADKYFPNANSGKGFNGTIYPPTTSFLMFPLAFFQWNNAKIIWMFFSTFIYFFTLYLLCMYFYKKNGKKNNIKIFITISLIFSPFHTGIALGQLSVVVICFMILSFLFACKQKNNISGLLLAISVGLKPQLALFYVFYFILNKNFKILKFFTFYYALIIFCTQSYPYLIDGDSLSSSWFMWLQRVSGGYGITGGDRFIYNDILKFNTVNIQILISEFFKDGLIVKIISSSIYIGMIGAFLYVYKKNKVYNNFLSVSLISILALLPVYHRYYDVAILIIPIAWCVLDVHKALYKIYIRVLLTSLLVFILPGGTILILFTKYLPEIWAQSFVWNKILLPHQVWVLFVSFFSMLSIMTVSGKKAVRE